MHTVEIRQRAPAEERVRELLRYFLSHGLEIYLFLPLLVTPIYALALRVLVDAAWAEAFSFAGLASFIIPSMGFNIHLVVHFIFLTHYREHLKTIWPNVLFQALLFLCGISLGISTLLWTLNLVGSPALISLGHELLAYLPVPAFGVASFFYFSSRYYRDEFKRANELAIEAEYKALKEQMQPHFLFNSLNTLLELIETNQGEAVKMTESLADLYRYILQIGQRPTAPLAAEISIVKKYLAIQQQRFGARLRYTIELPEEVPVVDLPGMLLQTLVENAIRHGISPMSEGGEIVVRVEKIEAGFLFRVSNTGKVIEKDFEMGTGLQNCIARLTFLYGEEHRFKLLADDHLTMVTFIIPRP